MDQPSHTSTPPDGPYRGLIFDFVGVLTADALAVHRQWCVSEGLDEQAWRRTLNTDPVVRGLYADLERGTLTQQEWNRRTAPILGVADHVNLMGRAWAGVRPAGGMVELARAARAAGYTVALLSNSFGLDPYDPYEACGVWELFDVAVVSEREGIAKPDPAIYRLTLERMGLRGEECVFVDDHPVNLPPAQALGITTVLATDETSTVARLEALLGVCAVPA
ncbi:putative hydrolase of the HAD superfamily [Kitasatospora sp. MAA4]|uniref:HAD family hydrolase n=1 Tax=Kitasatospora sp. MAA4 TaxID=3035093 RepID=UPI00247493A8|nr:HAD family phosphatase [Kitasatospora sp. MAA4]MDH6134269.1 putative hydrolase of the HAD superfamily [Kitasatospora sp. MAA4]